MLSVCTVTHSLPISHTYTHTLYLTHTHTLSPLHSHTCMHSRTHTEYTESLCVVSSLPTPQINSPPFLL